MRVEKVMVFRICNPTWKFQQPAATHLPKARGRQIVFPKPRLIQILRAIEARLQNSVIDIFICISLVYFYRAANQGTTRVCAASREIDFRSHLPGSEKERTCFRRPATGGRRNAIQW